MFYIKKRLIINSNTVKIKKSVSKLKVVETIIFLIFTVTVAVFYSTFKMNVSEMAESFYVIRIAICSNL